MTIVTTGAQSLLSQPLPITHTRPTFQSGGPSQLPYREAESTSTLLLLHPEDLGTTTFLYLTAIEHPEKAPSLRVQWWAFRKQLLRTTSIFCGLQCRATNTPDSSTGRQEPGWGPSEAAGMMPWEGLLVLMWVEETLQGWLLAQPTVTPLNKDSPSPEVRSLYHDCTGGRSLRWSICSFFPRHCA